MGAATGNDPVLEEILTAYGPQLGEMIWHSVHLDPRIETMVEAQGAIMRGLVERHGLKPSHRPIRILEVGAYSHFTVHQLAAELGGIGIANDISPAALRVGASLAKAKGIAVGDTLVASDFHDLPFSSGYFDLVFISSAVHHTFRPWIVLDELFRVVRPGGVLHIENEPVGRGFCLYQFRSNREASRTPFERAVEERGLTRILSSPFPGSRDEEMFGMIENDRIPLDIYLDAFARHGEPLALDLVHENLLGPVDHAALALPRDAQLATRLHDLLSPLLREAAQSFSEQDLLLGFSVPRREQIWSLCYATAEALRALPAPEDPTYRQRAASLFGASLRASFRQTGGTESDLLFRRSLPRQDGVHVDFPEPDSLRLDLMDRRLPEIGTASEADLAKAYPPEDWQRFLEVYDIVSMLNRKGRVVIRLPKLPQGGVLLMRYYAVAKPQPYVLRVLAPSGELGSQVIAQAESQLGRFRVAPDTAEVTLQLTLLDGTPIEDDASLHLSVAQLLPIRRQG